MMAFDSINATEHAHVGSTLVLGHRRERGDVRRPFVADQDIVGHLSGCGVSVRIKDASWAIPLLQSVRSFQLVAETAANDIDCWPAEPVATKSAAEPAGTAVVFPGEYDPAKAAVERWAALRPGWDDQDSPAPKFDQLIAANQLLRHSAVSGAVAPSPYISGDGEFGFRWVSGGGFASASFLPTGEVLLFALAEGANEPLRAEFSAGDAEWSGFAAALSRLS